MALCPGGIWALLEASEPLPEDPNTFLGTRSSVSAPAGRAEAPFPALPLLKLFLCLSWFLTWAHFKGWLEPF